MTIAARAKIAFIAGALLLATSPALAHGSHHRHHHYVPYGWSFGWVYGWQGACAPLRSGYCHPRGVVSALP